MSSPRVTTVLLPPAKGRSIGGDSRWPISRGMPREVSCDDKTGENSRPTIGEDSTPAHSTYFPGCDVQGGRRLPSHRHLGGGIAWRKRGAARTRMLPGRPL